MKEPDGRCQHCGYLTNVGRCSECGALLTKKDLTHYRSVLQALRWERLSLLKMLITAPRYVFSFSTLVMHPGRVPLSDIQTRHPVIVVLFALATAVLASMACDYREFYSLPWLLRQAQYRISFIVVAGGVLVIVTGFLLAARHPLMLRPFWRSTIYGLVVFLNIHMLWLLWSTLGLVEYPSMLSPFHSSTSPVSGSQRPVAVFYVTFLVPVVSALCLLYLFPIVTLINARRGCQGSSSV